MHGSVFLSGSRRPLGGQDLSYFRQIKHALGRMGKSKGSGSFLLLIQVAVILDPSDGCLIFGDNLSLITLH